VVVVVGGFVVDEELDVPLEQAARPMAAPTMATAMNTVGRRRDREAEGGSREDMGTSG
jgi:hypothetical protein